MPTNNELLRKADLAIVDLENNGGVLSAEQGNSFIKKLINSPTILGQLRVVEMLASQRNINKIGFGKRILRAATSGTALDTAAIEGNFDANAEATARAKPTTRSSSRTGIISRERMPRCSKVSRSAAKSSSGT